MLTIAFVNAQDVQNSSDDTLTFTKGTQFLNANFSVGLTDEKFRSLNDDTIVESESQIFNARVSYAYGIKDNLFLGLGFSYIHQTNSQGNSSGNQAVNLVNNSYGVFPYIRYYKGIGKRLALYFQGEIAYRHSNFSEFKTNTFTAGLRPGFTFMMSKNLALETSLGFLGYSTSNSENDSDATESDVDQFIVSLNATDLFVGLNYYF
jgi:hypothetical protein